MGFLGAARFCLPGGDWTSVCSSSVGEHDRCERADQCHTCSEYDRGPWPSYRGRAQPIVTYCWPSVSLFLFYDPRFRRRHVNLPWATVLRQAQLTEFRASILHRVRGRMECLLPGSEASGFCFLMKLNCGQCVYDFRVWLRRLQAGQVWLWCLDLPGRGVFYPLALLMQIEAETNSLGTSVYWWTLVMHLVCVCVHVFELRSSPFGSTYWTVSLAPGYPLL